MSKFIHCGACGYPQQQKKCFGLGYCELQKQSMYQGMTKVIQGMLSQNKDWKQVVKERFDNSLSNRIDTHLDWIEENVVKPLQESGKQETAEQLSKMAYPYMIVEQGDYGDEQRYVKHRAKIDKLRAAFIKGYKAALLNKNIHL
jgi:hypothetical protein